MPITILLANNPTLLEEVKAPLFLLSSLALGTSAIIVGSKVSMAPRKIPVL
jgi:hypothetical protein